MSLYRVLGSAIKGLDPEMLFDPLEEELYLPTTLVDLRYGKSRQREVVGEEDQPLALIGVVEPDAPEFLGITFFRIETLQDDGLIALDAKGFVHRLRVESL